MKPSNSLAPSGINYIKTRNNARANKRSIPPKHKKTERRSAIPFFCARGENVTARQITSVICLRSREPSGSRGPSSASENSRFHPFPFASLGQKNTPKRVFCARGEKSHSPLRGSHENLRVFVNFPQQVKTPVFTLSRSNLTILYL